MWKPVLFAIQYVNLAFVFAMSQNNYDHLLFFSAVQDSLFALDSVCTIVLIYIQTDMQKKKTFVKNKKIWKVKKKMLNMLIRDIGENRLAMFKSENNNSCFLK